MIDVETIKRWVAEGESETLEFKKTTGQQTASARAVCAMLNHRGGRVLFGVTPAGELKGQDIGDGTVEGLVAEYRQISPPATQTIDVVPLEDGKSVIAVQVETGSQRPYMFHRKTYKRWGNTNKELDANEHNEILLEQLHSTRRWENESADEWSLTDLDDDEIVRTINAAIRAGRLVDPGTRHIPDLLKGLGVMHEGNLLRAGVVLLGHEDAFQPRFPQCVLKLARFKGTTQDEFIDNKQEYGNAFALLARAQKFVNDYAPIAGRVIPGVYERADDPLYPPLAVREALANALCHRDYTTGSGSVAVAIYDDRLEITSSGPLHFGLRENDLYRRGHPSLPWNPTIASVFYRRGLIEQWGIGTIRIAEQARVASLPLPDIKEVAGAVVVTFRRARPDTKQLIIDLLRVEGALPRAEIARRLSMADRTVRRHLAELQENEQVEATEPSRSPNTRYALKGELPAD
jgi:ATP-dependent DNA helicase RecG